MNATDGVTFVWPVDFGDPSTTSTTIVMPPFRAGQTSGTLQQGRVPPPEDEEHAPPPAMNPRSGDAHTTAAAAQAMAAANGTASAPASCPATSANRRRK